MAHPPTARQAVAASAARLAEAAVESPRTEAELLVAEVLARTRGWLFLHPQAPLSPDQSARLQSLLDRRCRREPLPYLLGRTEFHGLVLHLTPAAIVPRPETEVLVEAAAARLAPGDGKLAADIGTGCGAIAVALAHQVPGLRVVALDLSLDALRLARRNSRRRQVADRVPLVCGDLLSPLRSRFDAVLANLPYIRTADFPHLQPEVRRFEPRLALDGGQDGLAVIRRLSRQLWCHLRTGGFAALEVGAGQAVEVANLLRAAGLSEVETVADYAGIARVVIGWCKGEARCPERRPP